MGTELTVGPLGETNMERQEWYKAMVEECKAIVTEAVFTSRWSLVEGYHMLGERIVLEQDFKPHSWGKNYVQRVGHSIGVSTQTLHYAIQFYNKYPDINTLPGGKNMSWRKVVALLPAPKTAEEKEAERQATRAETWADLARAVIAFFDDIRHVKNKADAAKSLVHARKAEADLTKILAAVRSLVKDLEASQ